MRVVKELGLLGGLELKMHRSCQVVANNLSEVITVPLSQWFHLLICERF